MDHKNHLQNTIKVEGKLLDQQQCECIFCNFHNHLVIAGAGSGKTTTIIGKIKYLLSQKIYRPEEILVLSFTHASALEMKERIIRNTRKYILNLSEKSTIHISTFHSLGLKILKETWPKNKLSNTIDKQIYEKCQNYLKEYQKFIDTHHPNQIIELGEFGNINPDTSSQHESITFDFSKMITLATEKIQTKNFVNPYKIIIIDEYQDISLPRYHLIQSLRNSKDCNLFCVGDDWQAIYRFAGSEIDLILNFEKYFGKTKLSRIEKTYRFPQSIIDVSSKFIMQNPKQIPKKVMGVTHENTFNLIEVLGDSIRDDLNFVISKLPLLPINSTIFFIGRYNFDLRYLKMIKDLQIDGESIYFPKRPDIKMHFLTAHRTKGLQADYIFILNCLKGQQGFPAIKHPSNIDEERRLFYVALTRAKKRVFLLTVHNQESIFIKEIRTCWHRKLKLIQLGSPESWIEL